MDETTKSIIARIKQSAAGKESFATAQLNPNELARLAADAVGHLDETFFDVAIGVAYEGILFAAAVAGGRPVNMLRHDGVLWGPSVRQARVIIVDDVMTDDVRLMKAHRAAVAAGAVVVGFAVIVDASQGRSATLPAPLWSADQNP